MDYLWPLVFLGVWILLQTWLLPRLGVPDVNERLMRRRGSTHKTVTRRRQGSGQ